MINFDEISNLDMYGKLAVLFRRVEEYHKEKKKCEEKCMRYEERLREVESATKVYASMLAGIKDSMDRMENRFYALTKTVFVMVGIGILGQAAVGLLVQEKENNKKQENSSIIKQKQELDAFHFVDLLKKKDRLT